MAKMEAELEVALKAASDLYGGISTDEDKVWRACRRKGSRRFDRSRAEALLRELGATDEQLGGCYVTAPDGVTYRETGGKDST